MSNIVQVPKFLRGMDVSNFVKNSRDQIRHSIDGARVVPRIQSFANKEYNDFTHTAVYKGLKNTGYDVRNLVQASREKLQTNKARNSDFQPTDSMRIIY